MTRHSREGTKDSRRPLNTAQISRGPEDNLRLSPEKRLCPSFDESSIALYRVASRHCMGWRVVDNICEEHMM